MGRRGRRILTLGVLLTLLLSGASAQTLDAWNRACRWKTGGATTVYSRADRTRVIATIPSGTYVKVADMGDEWTIISYRTADGHSGTGLAHTSDLRSAVVHFIDENGESRGLQELEYADQYGGISPAAGDARAEAADRAGRADRGASAADTAGSRQRTTAVIFEGEEAAVVQLGVYESIVAMNGEERTVLTSALVFAADVPADRAVAVIHAPRTGKCTLRGAAGSNAQPLGKCKAGAVVAVLAYGNEYCRISCNGRVGYVLTSCLRFSGGADAPIGMGVLTYNGKATGRTTINVRSAADGDARRIAQWRTGTRVTVFALENGWYEIEHQGLHGYVMQKYLTVDE